MTKPILAWHFVCDDRKLRDGSPLVIGETLVRDALAEYDRARGGMT